LGVTSPNTSNKILITTIVTPVPASPIRLINKDVAVAVAATLTSSFPMRIVVIKRRGSLRRVERRRKNRGSSFWTCFNFALVKEKKAVSDPEKKAERKSRPTINKDWIMYV
jgi:hypothetical protein